MMRDNLWILVVQEGRTYKVRRRAHESDAEYNARAMHSVATNAGLKVGDVFVRFDKVPRTTGTAWRWGGHYKTDTRIPGLFKLVETWGRGASYAVDLRGHRLTRQGRVVDPTPKTTYHEITREMLPYGLRWDVPRYAQGQIVEVAYAGWPRLASEADRGDTYKRVSDRSIPSVRYYQADVPRWGRHATEAELTFARIVDDAESRNLLAWARRDELSLRTEEDASDSVRVRLDDDRVVVSDEEGEHPWPGDLASYLRDYHRR